MTLPKQRYCLSEKPAVLPIYLPLAQLFEPEPHCRTVSTSLSIQCRTVSNASNSHCRTDFINLLSCLSSRSRAITTSFPPPPSRSDHPLSPVPCSRVYPSWRRAPSRSRAGSRARGRPAPGSRCWRSSACSRAPRPAPHHCRTPRRHQRKRETVPPANPGGGGGYISRRLGLEEGVKMQYTAMNITMNTENEEYASAVRNIAGALFSPLENEPPSRTVRTREVIT